MKIKFYASIFLALFFIFSVQSQVPLYLYYTNSAARFHHSNEIEQLDLGIDEYKLRSDIAKSEEFIRVNKSGADEIGEEVLAESTRAEIKRKIKKDYSSLRSVNIRTLFVIYYAVKNRRPDESIQVTNSGFKGIGQNDFSALARVSELPASNSTLQTWFTNDQKIEELTEIIDDLNRDLRRKNQRLRSMKPEDKSYPEAISEIRPLREKWNLLTTQKRKLTKESRDLVYKTMAEHMNVRDIWDYHEARLIGGYKQVRGRGKRVFGNLENRLSAMAAKIDKNKRILDELSYYLSQDRCFAAVAGDMRVSSQSTKFQKKRVQKILKRYSKKYNEKDWILVLDFHRVGIRQKYFNLKNLLELPENKVIERFALATKKIKRKNLKLEGYPAALEGHIKAYREKQEAFDDMVYFVDNTRKSYLDTIREFDKVDHIKYAYALNRTADSLRDEIESPTAPFIVPRMDVRLFLKNVKTDEMFELEHQEHSGQCEKSKGLMKFRD